MAGAKKGPDFIRRFAPVDHNVQVLNESEYEPTEDRVTESTDETFRSLGELLPPPQSYAPSFSHHSAPTGLSTNLPYIPSPYS